MPAVRNYPVYVGSRDVYYCTLEKHASNNRTTTDCLYMFIYT